MANSSVTITYSLQYSDADGKSVTPSAVSTTCPYQSQTVGTIDVPDATVSTTVYTVPFGAVTNAFLVSIVNKTGQSLSVKVNGGSTVVYSITNKGMYVAQAISDPLASPPVTAITLTTTATQSGAGLVEYRIFGDAI